MLRWNIMSYRGPVVQCKAHLIEEGDFLCPQSYTFTASNNMEIGIKPSHPFSCNIQEVIKME